MNMKTSPNDVSNQEILEALHSFAESVDERFDRMDVRLGSVEDRLTNVEKSMVTKVTLQDEMSKLKTTMVTKGYLDDKLADLQSDMLQTTRSEIQKAMG